MPSYRENRLLPYAPEQLFNLVADIEAYPSFLPWCVDARILERFGDSLVADLTVGFKGFNETFRSQVTVEPSSRITVSYGGGPLRRLANEWRFTETDGGTELDFFVDFSMRPGLLGGLMEVVFDKAQHRLVAAFEARAFDLYGGAA